MTLPNELSQVLDTHQEIPDARLWMADLLASLSDGEAEPSVPAEDESEGEPEATEDGALEASLRTEELESNIPDEDELRETAFEGAGFLDALFGWLADLFAAIFGGDAEDQPETDYAGIPADVSEDLVFIPLEPDQDLLDALEEAEAEEDLDLIL